MINQIRSSADVHTQEPRDDAIEGWARLFVFPTGTDNKPALEQKILEYMAEITSDPLWKRIDDCKILTLEHHMAARRMGFERMFEALASVDEFRTSFLDGTFGPARLFTHCVLPLVTAQKKRDKFAATRVLRELSPLLSKDSLKASQKPADQLAAAQAAITHLMGLCASTSAASASLASRRGSTPTQRSNSAGGGPARSRSPNSTQVLVVLLPDCAPKIGHTRSRPQPPMIARWVFEQSCHLVPHQVPAQRQNAARSW
ncbi:hypothetical protein [Mesorhizobium sp. M6A.T.Cr.TU.017.01.1.1]|uniref:hypothetical protein n=1 Tax=Mesorhizobium sp. M6A.T.Cr.TU.017.01.1.1 TaxID=2496774 RepID=UPI0019D4E71A|nr:hypothetical protein [Mesorhizobium sp. M6A.T.Cr.TU.017.01.1.1]